MPRLQKSKQNLDDVMQDYFYYCQLKDLRPKTIQVYEKSLKLFFKFLEEDYRITELEDVQEKHIKEYIEFTKERGKYSFVSDVNRINTNNPSNRGDFGKKVELSTIDGYLRNLKIFFKWCHNEKLIKEDITKNIKNIKFSRKAKDEVTTEEFNKLLKVFDLTLFSEYRDYICCQILLDCGLRIGECLELKVTDIDLKNKSIYITADIAKGRRDRYVFFSNTMGKMLQRWFDYKDRYVETDYIFVSNRGNKLSVSNFEKNFKTYLKRAKIDKNISPHSMRRLHGKKLLLSGLDITLVSRLLGHADIRTTLQAYMDLTTEDLRKSYAKFSPLESMRR